MNDLNRVAADEAMGPLIPNSSLDRGIPKLARGIEDIASGCSVNFFQ